MDGPLVERTIRIDVTLKGSLAAWLPGGRGPLELPEGTSVDGMLTILGVPEVHCIYVVNGSAVTRGARLDDGDRVQVFPPMAGG
jgi:sulfur carrier protein ThiS